MDLKLKEKIWDKLTDYSAYQYYCLGQKGLGSNTKITTEKMVEWIMKLIKNNCGQGGTGNNKEKKGFIEKIFDNLNRPDDGVCVCG